MGCQSSRPKITPSRMTTRAAEKDSTTHRPKNTRNNLIKPYKTRTLNHSLNQSSSSYYHVSGREEDDSSCTGSSSYSIFSSEGENKKRISNLSHIQHSRKRKGSFSAAQSQLSMEERSVPSPKSRSPKKDKKALQNQKNRKNSDKNRNSVLHNSYNLEQEEHREVSQTSESSESIETTEYSMLEH